MEVKAGLRIAYSNQKESSKILGKGRRDQGDPQNDHLGKGRRDQRDPQNDQLGKERRDQG